jgi:glycosyltransferase involved in cell wall biosynthesis
MNIPAVAVVTPVLNGVRWIEETVRSVLEQSAVLSGRVELRYIVMDGGSTDGTLGALRSFASNDLQLISERDGGMYSALANGFKRVSPGTELSAYINAGDLWHPRALDIALDAFEVPGVHWLSGYHVIYNEAGDVVYLRLPFKYRRRLFRSGTYGTRLPTVQQESTFWRSQLLAAVDLDRLGGFQLAGDHYLWQCFATQTQLHIVSSFLGGFRVHGGHLSDARSDYEAEIVSMSVRPSVPDQILITADRVIWQMPDKIKKLLTGSQLITYNLDECRWARRRARGRH